MKDPKRFSYSRFKTFQICPQKELYLYQQNIEPKENERMLIGSLFHECIEYLYQGLYPQDAFDTYTTMCDRGEIKAERDLLEYVVKAYMNYYEKDNAEEEIILLEHRMDEELDDGDTLEAVVDEVFRKKGYVYLRDRKTAMGAFKATNSDPAKNQQLLFYLPYVEKEIGEPVNVVQIDEIRFAKLEKPFILKNGRPTTDKNKLGLVTYEEYYNTLAEQGLEEDEDYQPILDYLEKRGHPLFRRSQSQMLENALIDANLYDMYSIYLQIKLGRSYRNMSPMCITCPYNSLCDLDMHRPSADAREAVIKQIKKVDIEEE